MIRNTLRIAFRMLWKKKGFTLINIAGLAIGLSAVLIILTYIRQELSYDRFHAGYENIFRITEEYNEDVRLVHSAMNHGPMADIISGRLPGLQHAVRILPYPAYTSADKIVKHRENNIIFADSTFFRVFTFAPVAGSLDQAFDSPFSVVLTRSSAIKYFGSTDVVGREFFYEDERDSFTFYVKAVMEDVPDHSHFGFDMAFNMQSLHVVMPWFSNWHYPPMYLYVKMENATTPIALEQTIRKLASIHQPEEVLAEKRRYYAQPIADIHLYSSLENEWKANNKAIYVRIFGGIAAFLLLIACINFMNLSTAQAAQRAREVGMRKILGAQRLQLVRQFMGEAFLVSFLSLLVSLGVAELLLMTFFKNLVGTALSLAFLLDGDNIIYLLLLLLIISVLSGLYPSFYLSRFNPLRTTMGRTEEPGSVFGLRRVLVVFQFFVSAALIIGTLVVLQQVSLLMNKNLGFEKEQLVALRMIDRHATRNYLQLKNDLARESGVLSVALSSELPCGEGFHGFEVNPEGVEPGKLSMSTLGVDEDYARTYGLKFVAGRDFSEDIPSDAEEAVVLNESAARSLGWTADNALGRSFEFVLYAEGRIVRKAKVIGVVADFNYQSLHSKVEPLVLYINKHIYYSDFLTVRFAGSPGELLDRIQQLWQRFHPEKPIDFVFLDDRLNKLYQSEMRISKIFSSFAVLSVLISCLGLFGLSAFSAQRRTREIGIRKVLGASVFQIIRLLSAEYAIMISVAVVLACPVAYYAAGQWLERFPYRTSPGFSVFALTLIIALLVGLVTVSLQSLRAALINPVRTLKSD